MNKCGDCILYQTGACADFETQDIDKACDRFLSDERYEEINEEILEQKKKKIVSTEDALKDIIPY